MIRRCEFERVLAAVRRSGAAEVFEAELREGRGGRPRQIGMDILLTGMVLASTHHRTASLAKVHKVLTEDLARSLQTAHNIRTRGRRPHTLTVRQVRYPLAAIHARLDPSAPGVDPFAAQERAERLQRLVDALIGASLPSTLPRPTDFALDETAIESHAKGRSAKSGEVSFDPDASWGYRTKTYDNKSDMMFGYGAFAMVGVPGVKAARDSMPILVHRLAVRPAGGDVVEPGLVLVDALAADGPVDTVLADRAWSHKTAQRWARPMRERGVELVFDLHPKDRGVQDFEGIAMVDGTPHCPAIPQRLVDIPRPATLAPGAPPAASATPKKRADHARRVAELEAFREAIAERHQYAFRRTAGPDADGKERWSCPAQQGRVTCGNCPASLFLSPDLPRVQDPPTGVLPKACSQITVTIPAEAAEKVRQHLEWGAPDWSVSYIRRSYVESAFGNLKNPKTRNVRRGWCFLVGLVRTSICLAVAVCASNMCLLRTWAERVGHTTDPLTTPDPPDHGFEELGPDGQISTTGPPLAT